jgi:hypothetical protein
MNVQAEGRESRRSEAELGRWATVCRGHFMTPATSRVPGDSTDTYPELHCVNSRRSRFAKEGNWLSTVRSVEVP